MFDLYLFYIFAKHMSASALSAVCEVLIRPLAS
jgi:hypothetical protein